MSERIAALVCEGQTDVPVLRAIIQQLWPSVVDVRSLQPELDQMGRARGRAGWSEVQRWCEQHAGELDEVLDPDLGDRIDLLVVAIDVDIAVAAGIADPPQEVGAYESTRLHTAMRRWLLGPKRRRLPPAVVLSTPVMAIETWVIAALFPRQRMPEQIIDPARWLVEREKLRVSSIDGKPWKELHRYVAFAGGVAGNLERVRKACPEAERTSAAILVLASAVGEV